MQFHQIMGQAVQSNSLFMAGSKLPNPEIHKYDWSAHVLSVDRNLLNPGRLPMDLSL
jgi:hypothetical protein